MALVTDGILTQKLPWGLVLIGVFLTLAIELMGLQSLPIAVGVYLPISTSCRDVRRRRGPLAGGAAGARRRAVASPRSSRGRACCSPAGSSPAARSPASPSPASPRRWCAGPTRRRSRPPTTWRTWPACRRLLGAVAASDLVGARQSSPAGGGAVPGREPLRMPPATPVSPAISARIIHAALVLGRRACSGAVAWYHPRAAPMPSEALPDRRVLYVALALVSATLFGAAAFSAGRLPASGARRHGGRMVAREPGPGAGDLVPGRGPDRCWDSSSTCSTHDFRTLLAPFIGLLLFANYRPRRLTER